MDGEIVSFPPLHWNPPTKYPAAVLGIIELDCWVRVETSDGQHYAFAINHETDQRTRSYKLRSSKVHLRWFVCKMDVEELLLFIGSSKRVSRISILQFFLFRRVIERFDDIRGCSEFSNLNRVVSQIARIWTVDRLDSSLLFLTSTPPPERWRTRTIGNQNEILLGNLQAKGEPRIAISGHWNYWQMAFCRTTKWTSDKAELFTRLFRSEKHSIRWFIHFHFSYSAAN